MCAAVNAESRADVVTREDLVSFINAAFSSTGQRDFYGDAAGQRVALSFLHEYVRVNYRRLYARTLAAGVNHFNAVEIVKGLLRSGRELDRRDVDIAREEDALIAAALRALPPQRALSCLSALARERVNNRRTRAVIRAFLQSRRDQAFDAVKYRSKVRALTVHAHLRFAVDDERQRFLFRGWQQQQYTTPLFETFRAAHYADEALYRLPYSIAEGLAHRRRIPREVFLKNITPMMTWLERVRLQETAAREGVVVDVDLSRAPLTKLCSYLLALPLDERERRRAELTAALDGAARRAFVRQPFALGKTAVVLDRSYSSSGSSERRRRPLAVALGVHALVQAASTSMSTHWSTPVDDVLLVQPRGQTSLARPLLQALSTSPDIVIVVSDGVENDPPGGATEVLRVWREKVATPAQRSTVVVHLNPVFSAADHAPTALGDGIVTIGVRDAEDLPVALGFARVAAGQADLAELHRWLDARVVRFIGTASPTTTEQQA